MGSARRQVDDRRAATDGAGRGGGGAATEGAGSVLGGIFETTVEVVEADDKPDGGLVPGKPDAGAVGPDLHRAGRGVVSEGERQAGRGFLGGKPFLRWAEPALHRFLVRADETLRGREQGVMAEVVRATARHSHDNDDNRNGGDRVRTAGPEGRTALREEPDGEGRDERHRKAGERQKSGEEEEGRRSFPENEEEQKDPCPRLDVFPSGNVPPPAMAPGMISRGTANLVPSCCTALPLSAMIT